jgi:glycosyltransferase involved in cell wall biosynthesis
VTGPIVSVIMTHHAEPEAMVRRALTSVLSQSVADIEVLLVTDAEHLPNVDDQRVRTVAVAPCGCYQKWNIAARLAVGEFIAFCPSDDEWLPGKLEAALSGIGDCALVTHQTQHVDSRSNPRITPRCAMEQVHKRTPDEWRQRFRRGNCIFAATVLYRRSLHDAVGYFDERMPARRLGHLRALDGSADLRGGCALDRGRRR